MNRTRYILCYNDITLANLHDARTCMSQQEKIEMDEKCRQIMSIMKFSNFESEAITEKAFLLGYIAAHMEYPR